VDKTLDFLRSKNLGRTPISIQKMNPFSFKLKLLSSLLYFLGVFFVSQAKDILTKYKILISLYIFVFLQLLLVFFFPNPTTQPQKLLKHEDYLTITNAVFNLEQINTYPVEFQEEQIETELMKFNNNLSEEAVSLPHRDQLINLALINLALNNEEEFREMFFKAKELDPNWNGWSVN
jgi:hypothetical protein